MKMKLLLLSLGVSFGLTSMAATHHVITLHGVRGNSDSYGDFHKIAAQNLYDINSSDRVVTYNWTYPVGSAVDQNENVTWTAEKIAQKFNSEFFLLPKAPLKNIPSDDKISIIAYSMGGMMTMSWYYNTMFNFENHQDLKNSDSDQALLLQRLSQVKNIIGLGAVYWGSLDAELGWSFLENGNLSQIKKATPKLDKLCKTPEAQKIISGSDLMALSPLSQKQLDQSEKQSLFIKNTLKLACGSLDKINNSLLFKYVDNVPSVLVTQIRNVMKKVGNTNALEMKEMSLTSDTINEYRIARIKHVTNSDLVRRFNAKWSNIIGVFPCLGASGESKKCLQFSNTDLETINHGLTEAFSGLNRRETDGPVISQSASSNFIFYTENKATASDIKASDFHQTSQFQNGKDIYVENMHATIAPALESLTGILSSFGQSASEAMKNFDQRLGQDVVIVNKECSVPETCKHPNYKYILEALGDCSNSVGQKCNQNLMNKYFNVSKESDRQNESQDIKDSMGSFNVVLNIRLPKKYSLSDDQISNVMSYIRFPKMMNLTDDVLGVNRTDGYTDPFALQIGRAGEIMSVYATKRDFSDSTQLRVILMGRTWAKDSALVRQLQEQGTSFGMKINLPMLQSREIEVLVKPTLSTYVDLMMDYGM